MAIGGFFPLESLGHQAIAPVNNVLEFWQAGPENSWQFANARSALAYLLKEKGIRRLWLPALICPELATVVGQNCTISYFPLDDDLSPDVEFLDSNICAGECVLGVDYFGRQPSQAFRDFVSTRNDVQWVEDRAQALAPAPAPWASWVLYSPRKLFGVPDGGILVQMNGPLEKPAYRGADVTAAVAARNDAQEDRTWRFELYQETERRMDVSMQGMSRLSRETLAMIDPLAVATHRRENFAVLARLLGDVALWADGAVDFAPLGLPVKIPGCDDVWRKMCASGVFPARHFYTLPSDPKVFRREHALGAATMTLPCDQRYGITDMHRVAAVFRASL